MYTGIKVKPLGSEADRVMGRGLQGVCSKRGHKLRILAKFCVGRSAL
jgi:hypothetical protein